LLGLGGRLRAAVSGRYDDDGQADEQQGTKKGNHDREAKSVDFDSRPCASPDLVAS
jgi:hypothetical protein